MQPTLELQSVSAGYGQNPIVTDFSISIPHATITTVIGANGAGKSTLLRAIFGLNTHLGGRILFEGQEIQTWAPAGRLRRGIGFVPQGRCNFPLMSVRENLQLGAYSLLAAKTRSAIDGALTLFPMLEKKLKVLAGNLSGGEQQILEMAMVMMTSPRLLLLDEPSLGLSPMSLWQVFDTLENIRGGGVTVLLVEQNAEAALEISDTGIVMELGRKLMEAPAATVLGDPRIKTAYLGHSS
jgi:branched-chain amino acid transport system ATP-binding protein